MIAVRFVDTNIALYAVSPLPEELDKRSIALELIDGGDLALSAQVLQEFYTQATRDRGPWQMTHDEAVGFITTHLLRFPVQDITLGLVHDAFALRARFGLNYWDCAILGAARLLGCDAVYSEDMSDTQDYDGLRVINPFANLPQPA
ncbi:MAG: PIN domain-containing protein [Chloroflexi bacterium]|nr:PIN domain-containing protein [Chloroflexota bacterium]